MPDMPFEGAASPSNFAEQMKLPSELPELGLLVGWSLEREHQRQPFGFSYGNPDLTPDNGWVDPVLLEGEGHIITIAPTGTGKGRSCIIPALLRHEGPVIVIDPKGENVEVTARRRREMGQQVVVLDPFGITDEPRGAFNPLDLIDARSSEAVDIAANYAAAMIDGRNDERNTFWYQRAGSLLSAMMLHAATEEDLEKRGLAQVRRLLANKGDAAAEPNKKPPTVKETLLASPHPEARLAGASLQNAAQETIGSILSMAQNGIDFLRGPLLEAATNRSSFDLDSVTRGDPLSIYIVIPPHLMESHGKLLRIWVMGLMSLITRRRGKPSQSTLFIIDEAAQLGALPQLRQALTLLRGYGLQCWSLWQDVSQLRLLYPKDWETMVNNCRVVQCFGAHNLMAARTMAEITGFGDAAAVLDLDDNQMLLQIAGEPAKCARKPDYLTDPAFKGQFDANPYHDRSQPIMPANAPRIELVDVEVEKFLDTANKIKSVEDRLASSLQRASIRWRANRHKETNPDPLHQRMA